MENGNAQRAVDILDAASQAFPNNLTVRKAVAGGYARVGRAKRRWLPSKPCPCRMLAGDFEGAIGAALPPTTKTRPRFGCARPSTASRPIPPSLPSRPAMSRPAATTARRRLLPRLARCHAQSLARRPARPCARLSRAEPKTHRAVTAADLQRLLDPDYEPFAKTTKLPPLPAYGPDPYNGGAPVVLPQAQPSQPAPQAPHPGAAGPGSKSQPLPKPVPNAAVDRDLSAYGAHIVLASWQRSRPVFRGEDDFLSFGLGTSAAIQSSAAATQSIGQVEITANPPHSLASDTWKGLVFSLMAGDRNAEALQELDKIPPDVRRQLESDIEWVQGIASPTWLSTTFSTPPTTSIGSRTFTPCTALPRPSDLKCSTPGSFTT